MSFSKEVIEGTCDIHLLHEKAPLDEKIKLLSFLCQIDCRQLPENEIEASIEYFRGLGNSQTIAHPTDFFRIIKET